MQNISILKKGDVSLFILGCEYVEAIHITAIAYFRRIQC